MRLDNFAISHIEWLSLILLGLALFAAPLHTRKLAFTALLSAVGGWLLGNAGALLAAPAVGSTLLLLIRGKTGKLPYLTRLAAGGSVVCGVGFYCTFPLPRTPKNGGPFEVGTRIVEIPMGGHPVRPLVVQVWYPSRHSSGELARWLPDKSLAPRFPFHRIAWAKIEATVDAPVAERAQPWPVIFYEHAWLGHRNENVAQVMALASRGFVVVAVDHPGQAKRITYRNGDSISGSLPTVPDFSSEDAIASFENEARRLMADRTREIEHARIALAGGLVADLGASARWSRMGVFGFSFGGSTALHLCASQPAFIAGANEDGLYLDVGEPHGPFLFFDQEMPPWLLEKPSGQESAERVMVRRAEQRTLHAMTRPDRQRHILEGTSHLSFTDRKFLSPLPWITRTGSHAPSGVHEAILFPLASFFQHHLEADQSPSR